MGVIELKSCVTDEIGLVSRDVCARPNTFELKTVRRQQAGERNTLVTTCYDTLSTTKHWLSSDTKEDRLLWTSKLNEALRNVRAWHSDAMKPVKRPVQSSNVSSH
jgi:actin-binding protein anillin